VDQIAHCIDFKEDSTEYQEFTVATLFNIGIIHLCKADYSKALEFFQKAETKSAAVPKSIEIDHNVSRLACERVALFAWMIMI